MTLKEWKSRLQVGTELRCTYRHYEPVISESVKITRTQGNAVVYDITETTRILKGATPGHNYWMYFPKASELKADEQGFELYMGDGKLMSRYEWIPNPMHCKDCGSVLSAVTFTCVRGEHCKREQGYALTPVIAILTAFTIAAVLIAQSGLLRAVLARLAEIQ